MTDQMHMEQYVVGMVATNCYLIYHTQTKEALLIDPGAEAQRLMDEMARLEVTPVAVLLTHGHFDHAQDANQIAEAYQIPVYAYVDEQQTLEDPRVNLSGPMAGTPARYHADVYVRDEQELDLAGSYLSRTECSGLSVFFGRREQCGRLLSEFPGNGEDHFSSCVWM